MKLSGMLAERSKARNTPGKVLPLVKEGMLRDYALDNHPGNKIYPSELAHQDKFCPRSVYLRITEGPMPNDDFNFIRENIFNEGDHIHAKWQERFRKYLPLWGDWDCMICGQKVKASTEPSPYGQTDLTMCDYDGGHIWEYTEARLNATETHLMSGRADGAFGTTLIEIKSIGEGTVRSEDPVTHRDSAGDLKALWKGITRPFKSHLAQGDIYLGICVELGLPFREIAFVYESKWNQQVKEFVIPYNATRSNELLDQALELKYCVDNQEEPDCRWGPDCKECKPYDARREIEPKRVIKEKG